MQVIICESLKSTSASPKGPGSPDSRKMSKLAQKISKLTIELSYAKADMAKLKEKMAEANKKARETHAKQIAAAKIKAAKVAKKSKK